MGHEHAEIVIPPTADVPAAIREAMESFREEEMGEAEWWDSWRIGGRWQGDKLLSGLDPDRLQAFFDELTVRKVTVSSVKTPPLEIISLASQIPAVDALWQEMFPGKGLSCPLHQHAEISGSAAICTVADVPERLACFRLIIAAPWQWMGKTILKPAAMRVMSFWNGVDYQDTNFDGYVKPVLLECLAEPPRWWCKPEEDWLVVTVDSHS